MSIHVGDIGTIFRLTVTDSNVAVSLVGATVKIIVFKKPDGTIASKTAAFTTDGTDGKIEWASTVSGDLDQPGLWQAQALVTLPAGTWRADSVSFTVFGNLS